MSTAPTSHRAGGIKRYPFVQRAYADGGYAGRLVKWAKTETHIVLEIIRRKATKGFEVLPRRWVVERTFAWIMKNRRFARDYEQLTDVAETLIIAACATLSRDGRGKSLLKRALRERAEPEGLLTSDQLFSDVHVLRKRLPLLSPVRADPDHVGS